VEDLGVEQVLLFALEVGAQQVQGLAEHAGLGRVELGTHRAVLADVVLHHAIDAHLGERILRAENGSEELLFEPVVGIECEP